MTSDSTKMATSQQKSWERAKVYSKRGFEKAWHTLDKLGRPINRLSMKFRAEAFWPSTLDLESEKAARILRSFYKGGFYAEIDSTSAEGLAAHSPSQKRRAVKRIPTSVIAHAKGLAIFTTMRTGLWVNGSGGSGVLLGRIKETGEWSHPSGIMAHTAELEFLTGVDIYDCVVVINSYEALEAFKRGRCTLGRGVAASKGPIGPGGNPETKIHQRQAPTLTYIKGRGLYADINAEGTLIIERCDENERFYGGKISAADVLAGNVKHPSSSIRTLLQTIKAAQGDMNIDVEMLLAPGETPGDVEVEPIGTFGIPADDDPDPYGVKALEREGILIREAGTRRLPNVNSFDFSPTSSKWSATGSTRSSFRNSVQSFASIDRGTQTDGLSLDQASQSSICPDSPRSPRSPTRPSLRIAIPLAEEIGSVEYTKSIGSAMPARQVSVLDHNAHSLNGPASASFAKAKLVTIPKRTPPSVPHRNPRRQAALGSSSSLHSANNGSSDSSPSSSTNSPVDTDMSVLDVSSKLRQLWSEDSQSDPKTRGDSQERDEFVSAPASPPNAKNTE
ncbi:hypothetical protein LOZ36_004509 [Ophidiomyces ophidiicola]|nr:hypothetical protein LOZ36_004509 [Ophidiomyces ophidiicola]